MGGGGIIIELPWIKRIASKNLFVKLMFSELLFHYSELKNMQCTGKERVKHKNVVWNVTLTIVHNIYFNHDFLLL